MTKDEKRAIRTMLREREQRAERWRRNRERGAMVCLWAMFLLGAASCVLWGLMIAGILLFPDTALGVYLPMFGTPAAALLAYIGVTTLDEQLQRDAAAENSPFV